jgi:protein-S-isoprenylcysteine O-methyltransferase Ste14
MNLLGDTALGIIIFMLLGMLVIIKRAATGDILDKPQGNLLVQLVNIFNLFFLLVVNPLAGVLLFAHRMAAWDPTNLKIEDPLILTLVELAGLISYVAGFLVMAWALVRLGKNYQLGGSAPRSEDKMIVHGPYRLIRHPMYASALSISLGLSLLIQSWAFLLVFGVYLLLIFLLMPLEEERLLNAYGDKYLAYQRRTHKLLLIPRGSK